MRSLNSEERKLLRRVASFYGCRAYFIDAREDGYWNGYDCIYIGTAKTFEKVVSIFFHELAHYVNSQTNRYPHYHNLKLFKQLRKRLSYGRFVRYCLRAELYTDQVGRELLREWFPTIRYRPCYRNTRADYEFLNGYFLEDK